MGNQPSKLNPVGVDYTEKVKKKTKLIVLNPFVKIPFPEKWLCIGRFANKLFIKWTLSIKENSVDELDHSGGIKCTKFLPLWRVILKTYDTLQPSFTVVPLAKSSLLWLTLFSKQNL